jgi:hypothetical protein
MGPFTAGSSGSCSGALPLLPQPTTLATKPHEMEARNTRQVAKERSDETSSFMMDALKSDEPKDPPMFSSY